jgi:predicted transcriptional regulator
MTKDTQLTFRIRSDLKKELETIAAREGRSVAQVCEAFLKAGSESYKKKGSGFVQRFLAEPQSRPKDG